MIALQLLKEVDDVGLAVFGEVARRLVGWRELRNRWFADSALEGTGFEPSVPRDTTNLSSRLWLVPANRKVGAKENRHTKRRALPPIAVGTPITGRPPHRTVRAAFLHTAPTSDV